MSFGGINKLRNRYFAVRHGESEANIAHLISSNPEIGTKIHGLSSHGRIQVAENTKLFLQNHPEENSYVVISSDFRRAYETAEILAANLSNRIDIQVDQRLRERFFGIYDNTSDENYKLIWKNDEENPVKNLDDQVESVESVRKRTTDLIKDLEEKYDHQIIFLVSHGDALQILQTAFERLPNANQQRHLQHIERAEFRSLILK
jgi:probable phosphoglycerate mutase